MKASGLFVGCTIFITFVFYLLAYYFLPPPPHWAPLMVLFAAIASVLVWVARWGFRKAHSKKTGHVLLLVAFSSLGLLCYPGNAAVQRIQATCNFTSGPRAGTALKFELSTIVKAGQSCSDGEGSAGQFTAVRILPGGGGAGAIGGDPMNEASHQSAAAASAAADSAIEGDSANSNDQVVLGPTMPRVTGVAPLLPDQREQPGYGLYSYVLLTHVPEESELPKYRAFLTSMVELPVASDLSRYVQKIRINITYFPLKMAPSDWDGMAVPRRVDYVLAHYDYARGTAMLASLPGPMGAGPVIASVLKPLSYDQFPHPVLVQDLSKAQPDLMGNYVKEFCDQAAKDHFWEEKSLEAFSLHMENFLETAAVGLSMSKVAVFGWIKVFK
jgi:hypothetical protein